MTAYELPRASRRCSAPSLRWLAGLSGALLLSGCVGSGIPSPDAASDAVEVAEVRAALFALAADSMQGRMTGSQGAAKAARYIADRLRDHGAEPAYAVASGRDSAYFQGVPLALPGESGERSRPTLLPSWSAWEALPPEQRLNATNVVGVIRGSDPDLRDEAVIVGAHFDHVGIGRAVNGDSIYNGADDDASGVVAVLEIARALAAGPPPRRTVVLLLTTGEEFGLLGTRWYLQRPLIPLERTVADLQIEMIGRPDSLAGGPGRGWLTGFERSTVGERLAAAGVPLLPDPRPSQNFFLRSDNIAFACRGIPAHTLSSYGMHPDYHTPDDEPDRVDLEHMEQVVEAAVQAVRLLASGPAPEWKPGGSPVNAPVCTR